MWKPSLWVNVKSGLLRNIGRARFDRYATSERRHTIYVDVSIISKNDAGTGIQRVVRALSQELRLRQSEVLAVRFVAASKSRPYREIGDGFLTREPRNALVSRAIDLGPGDIFLGLDLANRILPRRGRQIARWRRRGARIAIVIYDLLPVSNPEWFDESQATAFCKWLEFICRHGDDAICISKTVQANFLHWTRERFGMDHPCIRSKVIPLGGNLPSTKSVANIGLIDETRLKAVKRRPFVIVVGTIEPRKGHRFVLDAFDRLYAKDNIDVPTLVVVGRPGWKTAALQARMREHAEAGRRFFWFEDADDEMLDELYKSCAGVIFPTLAEGYGLPLAEAVAHARPVLARDLPVFREHSWGAVSYFQDDSPDVFADKIIDWLANTYYPNLISETTVPTWHTSCEKLLAVLQCSSEN